MATPIRVLVALTLVGFAALGTFNFLQVTSSFSGWIIVGVTAASALEAAAAAIPVWLVGMVTVEIIDWFGPAGQPRRRIGHRVTFQECQYAKADIQRQLAQAVPGLAIDAVVLATAPGVAAFAGIDLYRRYRQLGQPWIWWNQAEATLVAGGHVWHYDPGLGPGREFADIAGPY